jgi:uncharacterized protein
MGLIDELRRFRVVDAHAHNWNLFADTAYMRECLDRFDLQGIVILSNLTGGFDPEPHEIEASNEATAHLRDAVGARILPFCYVNAAHTDHALSEIERWGEQGFCALKFWVSQRATDERTYTVTEAALERGWPILYHSYYRTHGEAPPHEAPPLEIAEWAARYPQGQFIMAHFGAQFEHGLRAIEHCKNVAVDYSGSINEKGAYEMALDILGPERVLFGTDLPGADYYVNAGRVLELDVADTVKQQIFAGNIERILGL